jgi:hypothetical protein
VTRSLGMVGWGLELGGWGLPMVCFRRYLVEERVKGMEGVVSLAMEAMGLGLEVEH